jgi:acetyl esterase/lipase
MGITRRNFVKNGLAAGIGLGLAPSFLRAGAMHQPPAAPVSRLPLQKSIQAAAVQAPAPPGYAVVDPELVPALKTFPTVIFSKEMLPALRTAPSNPPLPPPAPQPTEKHIPGPAGAPDLRLVIYDPAPGAKGRPAFLHIHGGGYVMGKAGEVGPSPSVLQVMAQSCGCLVVSVDYRLAPETRFPGSLEDNYTALRWLHKNADSLGVDPKRIAIGGESAGGGHSAMLAIAARDRKEIPILFQMLIYPMLDDRTGSTRPVPPPAGEFIWVAASNRFGWTSLLGVPAGSPSVPAGAVPARVENLAGLPLTFIGVGSIDLFADEDIEYARRLNNAGVPTELHVIPGAYHGFDVLAPDAAVSARFTETWKTALKRAYANA